MKTLLITLGIITIFLPLLSYGRVMEFTRWQNISAVVTAYTADQAETDEEPLITASGHQVAEGVAACPRHMPFHSVIRILGREYVCLDRMARRFKDRFDIFMSSKENALQFGKKTLVVEILR